MSLPVFPCSHSRSLTATDVKSWGDSFEKLMASESKWGKKPNRDNRLRSHYKHMILSKLPIIYFFFINAILWFSRTNPNYFILNLLQVIIKVLLFSEGRKIFRAFLRCEYSEENILFWLACEDLKRERSPELIEEKARIIYEDYVSILSPREVRRPQEQERSRRGKIASCIQTARDSFNIDHRNAYAVLVKNSGLKKFRKVYFDKLSSSLLH